jgi:hypothetical protein
MFIHTLIFLVLYRHYSNHNYLKHFKVVNARSVTKLKKIKSKNPHLYIYIYIYIYIHTHTHTHIYTYMQNKNLLKSAILNFN